MTRWPAALVGLAIALTAPAAAQTGDPFSTIHLIVGFGPGGDYDLWTRTLAHHYGKHLPGHPTIVPQYMQGAGSYVAAGHMANVAPRDGSRSPSRRAFSRSSIPTLSARKTRSKLPGER